MKAEGNALLIATFREWDSHIECGADIRLVAVVPNGLKVEQRAGLSGEKSVAWDREAGVMARGWQAVPDEPDTERKAEPPFVLDDLNKNSEGGCV